MEIKRLEQEFSICKISGISSADFNAEFCFLGKTDEEISLVCPTFQVPESTVQREDGWKAFRIQGVLDFTLIGILSGISTVLSENSIGIFAISTYNTDYILTKADDYEKAIDVLEKAGYRIV